MDKRRRLLMAGENIKADKTLANNSWETIGKVARKGLAKKYWKIGDEKEFNVGAKVITAVIIGFDHDDVADSAAYGRNKAGITFQMKGISFDSRYSVNDNEDGGWLDTWKTCFLRTSSIPGYLNTLNEDLKNEVVAVNKICSCGKDRDDTEVVVDKIFVPSEQEVFGVQSFSKAAEGIQYEFYSAGNSKIKFNESGVAKKWWTRSIGRVYVDKVGYICSGQYKVTVTDKGKADNIPGYSFTGGVSFAFCV